MRRPRFHWHGLNLAELQTCKSMAMLGPASFGPPCPECGKPQTKGMTASMRNVVVKIAGKQPYELAGVCQCWRLPGQRTDRQSQVDGPSSQSRRQWAYHEDR